MTPGGFAVLALPWVALLAMVLWDARPWPDGAYPRSAIPIVAIGWAVAVYFLGVPNEPIVVVAVVVFPILLAGAFGVLIGGKIAPPGLQESWLKTYQPSIVGIIAVSATLLTGLAAWTAVQRQIANQRIMLQAQQDTAQKQRRLDYLRQYVPQVAEALAWINAIQGPAAEIRAYLYGAQPLGHPMLLPDDRVLCRASFRF